MNLLVVNAGSSSLKLGVLSPDDDLLQSESLPSDRGDLRCDRAAALHWAMSLAHRCGRTPHRARRDPLRRSNAARPGHHADPRQACSTGALAPDVRPAGCRNRPRRLGRCAGGGVLRHGLSRRPPRSGGHLRRPTGVERSLGRASLWLPRPEPCLRLATHDRAHGAFGHGCPRGHLPPGCRSIAGRRRRGPFGRHDDGLHPLRRAGHGHPIGHDRPRPDPLARSGARHHGPRHCRGRSKTNQGCTRSPARPTWRRSRRSSSRVTTRPDWPSTSTCTGCEQPSRPWPAPWGVSTP